MALHLVTGYKGEAHITAADQGVFNAYTIGAGEYVLTNGDMFRAEIITNNKVKINGGTILMQGRQVNLDAPVEVDISNGTLSFYRNDLIVLRYRKDQSTGVESIEFRTIKGTETKSTPVDPAYYTTSILDGEMFHDMPLYRVKLVGLNIEAVEPLFQALAPMADMQRNYCKQNLIINGDFQYNHRGTVSFNPKDSIQYTLDMWRAHQVVVNDLLGDGVQVTGASDTTQGYFTQFIHLDAPTNKTYTISAMVDGKVCTFTVTPSGTVKEKDFGTFKISTLITNYTRGESGDTEYKLKINICPIGTNSINIKYVDVFEGTVTYPHVKEDPAIALMRCRRYVQENFCACPIVYKLPLSQGSTRYDYRTALPFDDMADEPTIELATISYYDDNYANQTLNATDLNVRSVGNHVIHVRVTLGTTANQTTSPVSGVHVNASYPVFKAEYTLSCEPYPNGER